MKQWHLSEPEYKTLVKYMGCGNFSQAKLLFFGNEEGLAGNQIEANLVSRITTFGAYGEDGKITSSLIHGEKASGFWEPNAQLGGDKVHAYLYEQGVVKNKIKKNFTKGFFLPMAARICLTLENPNENPLYWFQPKGVYLAKSSKTGINPINDFIINGLFRPRNSGIETALTDWHPLPRAQQRGKPEEYSLLEWNLYKAAFSDPFSNTLRKDEFSCYSDDARSRALILQSLLQQYQVRVMIGFGDIEIKSTLISKIFPGSTFKIVPSEVFPNHNAISTNIKVNDKSVYVILLPFPDPTTGTWNSFSKEEKYPILLSYFAEMTTKYIKPHFSC